MSDTSPFVDPDADRGEPLGGGAGDERPFPPIGRIRHPVTVGINGGGPSDTDEVYQASRSDTRPAADQNLAQHAHVQLNDLADQFREHQTRAEDPRLRALLDSAAETMLQLATTIADHARSQRSR
ncbi:hypothetical protein [Pseudonocardia sp.]|jgi:hypothetical protein|uniref:hypothetical protein n=1 Tax=Pseudonocardia sp. TaxID=60912 RepID=UPI0031FDB922